MQLPDFLTQDEDGYIHVTGRRVGLLQLVNDYNEGYSAEMLALEYDSVSLAVIHKTIAYYLENQAVVDGWNAEFEREMEQLSQTTPRGPSLAELRQRLARRQAKGA